MTSISVDVIPQGDDMIGNGAAAMRECVAPHGSRSAMLIKQMNPKGERFPSNQVRRTLCAPADA